MPFIPFMIAQWISEASSNPNELCLGVRCQRLATYRHIQCEVGNVWVSL